MQHTVKEWFLNLGPEYGVDPLWFGIIYVGAIPFFSVSVIWLLRNVKQRKPIVAPVFCSLLFFLSSYVYIFIAAENVPWWVYLIVVAVLATAGSFTFSLIRKKVAKEIADDA